MVILMNGVEENLNIPEEQKMGVSDYEQSREERIKENLERMQKLGILDLSLKLKSLKSTPNRPSPRRTPQSNFHSVLAPSGPVRRSSRLQNSTPVSYSEVQLTKKDKSLEDDDLLRAEGSKPEVYTDEHEKLLGSTEMSWTLFVDGYGKDGKRIYDPVRGKTCHQCRQKTLGHRTHCSTCNLVQGQFCGDCLYMRYGENVLEANENPNWMCPVCRGICNCSLCRQAKGWPPTGTLYRKISSLGYKSVAHYLVQTRRAKTDSDENVGTKVPVSAKRSLPFLDTEATPGEDDQSKSNSEYLKTDPVSEVDTTNDDLNNKTTEETRSKEEFTFTAMAPKSVAEPELEPAVATQSNDQVKCALETETETETCVSAHDEKKEANFLVDHKLEESNIELKTFTVPLNDPFLTESSHDNDIKKNDAIISDNENIVASKESPKSTEKSEIIAQTPDSISGRLRERKNKRNATEDPIRTPDNCNTIEELGSMNAEYSTKNAENTTATADVDSIASRLKRRRRA